MDLSRHTLHLWIIGLAMTAGVIALMLPKKAGAEDSRGYYTTNSTSTSTSSTNAATGVTTTTTNTSTNMPRSLYSTDGGRDNFRYPYGYGDDNGYHNDPDRTSDLDARYPYDSTDGTNRSDVDAVRSGFDDPRNPWDGRYSNDNPANHSGPGANETVNSMRGNENMDRYRPGNYGTYPVHRD